MKVVCIDNTSGNARQLIQGKIYDAINRPELANFYIIKIRPYVNLLGTNNFGGERLANEVEFWVNKSSFITLEEWREKQLRDLLG